WQVRLRPLCGSAAWWSPGRRRAPFAAAASLSRRIRPQPGMPVDRDVERGARRARRRAPRPPRTRARVACARGLECPRTSRSREWREIAWPNRGGSRARPQRASLPACPCSACGARAVPPAAEAASTGTALATLSDMNTSPSLFVSVAAAGLAGVAAFLTPNTARADRVVVEESSEDYEARHSLDVAFDGEGAIPLMDRRFQSGNDLTGGGGFKVRVGEQIRFPRLRFTPELGYGYDHLFGTDNANNAFAWDMHRLFAGARVGFGRVVVPTFYGHVGYGWRDTRDPSVAQASGVALDVGFALDFHVVPHLGFGAHVEYAAIDAQPYTPQWLALGLHADLAF